MAPSESPSSIPTLEPIISVFATTESPTGFAVTPSPTTLQDTLECDEQIVGDYNDESIELNVSIPFDGDMTFTATINGADSLIKSLIIRDSIGNIVGADGDTSDPDGTSNGVRLIEDLPAGSYTVELDGVDGVFAVFALSVDCATGSPSMEPTGSPTTPSPTNPLEIISCGEQIDGDFNNEPVRIYVDVPSNGNVLFDGTGTDDDGSNEFNVSLTVWNSSGLLVAFDGGIGDDDGAQNVINGQIAVQNLPVGIYIVILNSVQSPKFGKFSLEMTCTFTTTDAPTAGLTTPSPTTLQSALECDDDIFGDYNDETVRFNVTFPFDGALAITAQIDGDSDFLRSLIVRDSDGNIVGADGDTSDPDGTSDGVRLLPSPLAAGTYTVDLEGEPATFGVFNVQIDCESAAPTRSPTAPSPTATPTYPEYGVQCNEQTIGSYDGGTIEFDVETAFDGDVSFLATLTSNNTQIPMNIFIADNMSTVIAAGSGSVNIQELAAGQYTMTIAAGKSGTFIVSVVCDSESPSNSPIVPSPSLAPSANPTTPSPTNPQEVAQCGDWIGGDYNDETVVISVSISEQTDITFSSIDNGGTADIHNVTLELFADDSTLILSASETLDIYDLDAGDYTVELTASPGQIGTFYFEIWCFQITSESPTVSPTTRSPTISPVALLCGDSVSGDYRNGTDQEVTVNVGFDGDITFSGLVDGVAPDSAVIRDSNDQLVGADNDLNDPDGSFNGVRTVTDLVAGTYTVILYDPNLSGTFVVSVECSSDSPTTSPTTSAPTAPTMTPSAAPTFTVCDTEDALNIAFLMDESGSVDSAEWDVMTNFVDRIATFDVAGPSYVSLFEYASLPAFKQFLDWTGIETGKAAVTSALSTNPYNSAGLTYTWDAVNRFADSLCHD